MAHEYRYMTVTEARDFLKATPARSSEYALHLRIQTYAAEAPRNLCEEEARTYMDLTRRQVFETLDRMALEREHHSKTICIGISRSLATGKTLYWLG